ncbi:FecCD family ABC transporter permease [Clostridium massiliamazoniense]|uniref:FecCD family ABC transporter permease n=1 Tax=Clostridium massiliamazoniense TaxID=1347366 RepID=UPI0006D7AE41|nr:iron ABC transporter permease [Clostridium massiliamazoniense]
MKNKSKVLLIGLSVVVLATLIIVLSAVGSVKLGIGDIFSTLIKGDNKMVSTIVFQMRLPRNILAVLVGANLAISGCLLQSVMKNPLADPGITGVSSGASLFAIIVLLLLPQYTGMLPLIAFVGGAIACVLVYTMAWKNGLKVIRVVLAGVAVNAIIGGFISLLTTLYSDRIQSALLWLNGSLASKTWADVRLVAIYSLIGLALSLFCIRGANVLNLSDEAATNLGFNVNKTRLGLSAVAVFLAATSTAIVGIISFVGLIVPHISRMIIGSDHKYSIPFSMVLGGIVLLVADTVARTLFGAIELPVGVVMSIVGGPFFLYLLRKRGGE